MIYQKLLEYKDKDIYPFHMPGHKRIPLSIFDQVHPFEIDYTEVDGLDDLHEPEEMFRASMDMAKEFYGTEETYYLVNGSTSGIMAAISSVCNYGDTIIISRNCHKSVYMAIELLGLHPVYIYPQTELENGLVVDISTQKIRECVDKHPEAKAVMLVSPTYEGNVMNIKEIAMCTSTQNMALIVDEAHGAHFPFWDGEKFGVESAIHQGADMVIQSLHKTMPALTQTALLHVCSRKVPLRKVEESLSYFQTTSPSYLFSASIDWAIRYGVAHRDAFDGYYEKMVAYRNALNGKLRHLKLIEVDDPGKIVISTAGTDMTGKKIYDILLNVYRLQMEMMQETYVLAMTSICDTQEGLDRLEQALIEIDQTVNESQDMMDYAGVCPANAIVYDPYVAKRKDRKGVQLYDCAGRISGEYVYLYPPGIPLIVPGERISAEAVDKIGEYERKNLKIKGFEGVREGILQVIV